MAEVEVSSLGCSFPGGVRAVDDVSFTLAAGELFCLLGPSGCGKSTLLRLLGGYLQPDGGRIRLNGKDITDEPPERRRTGMVFQNYALFPHLNALDNVAFGLRVRGVARSEREKRAHEMLDWVGLSQDERRRRPAHLSGGQQQRVALARALAFEPHLLMLDEPFANLDRLLRDRLREEMREVQRRAGITTILVTHDREEAFALADRMAVMDHGRLLQIGTPREVHDHPASARVADFLGHRNLFAIRSASADKLELEGGLTLPPVPGITSGRHALIWPERILTHAGAQPHGLPGMVRRARFAGGHTQLSVELAGGAVLETRADATCVLMPGAAVTLVIPPEAVTHIPAVQ